MRLLWRWRNCRARSEPGGRCRCKGANRRLRRLCKSAKVKDSRFGWQVDWVGLSDLAQPRLTKGGQPYLKTEEVIQRETGNRRISWGHFFQVSGLGPRVSGSGVQVQVRVRDSAIRPLSSIQSSIQPVQPQPLPLPLSTPLHFCTFALNLPPCAASSPCSPSFPLSRPMPLPHFASSSAAALRPTALATMITPPSLATGNHCSLGHV